MTKLDKAISGLVRCRCGCKYWRNLRCVDCGAEVAEYPDQLDEDAKWIAANLTIEAKKDNK